MSNRTGLTGDDRALRLPARVEVPASPDMTVERFTVIAAPPDVIYRVLVAVSDWPTWDPSVTVARPKAPRPLTAGDSFFKQESGFAIEARVLEAEPGRLLRWRGSPPGGGVVGVHSYRLVPIGGGRTLVVDREEFSRWYLRLFGWATDLHIGRQYQATLAALRTTVESSLGAVSSALRLRSAPDVAAGRPSAVTMMPPMRYEAASPRD